MTLNELIAALEDARQLAGGVAPVKVVGVTGTPLVRVAVEDVEGPGGPRAGEAWVWLDVRPIAKPAGAA